jgi:uncharacterized protein (DUF362 family)
VNKVRLSSVHITKANEPYTSIRKMLDNMALPVAAGKIAVKLNMCDYRLPETGAVSDPAVVDSLIAALREKYPYAEIMLIENDATTVKADIMFRYLGIDTIAKQYEAKAINLAHEKKWEKIEIDGYHFKCIDVPSVIANCDLLITHPKLKTHSMTKISCGLKNIFGCYKERRKVRFHKFLDEAIVDINLALRPNISIVDANICHEGIGGPIYGLPRKVGLLIYGMDIVAVDAFCARLIGFDPGGIGHIRKSEKKGLGNTQYELKNQLPDRMKNYRFSFNRSLFYLFKVMRRLQIG